MHEESEKHWLAATLTDDIPLGAAMALEVTRLDEHGIALSLPLAPNINDKGTAFGGAMASAMILAGWSLPRLLLRREGLDADLVIGRCELRFLKPVKQDFSVQCDWPDAGALARFFEAFRQQGRGKLDLAPEVICNNEVVATLQARYAALARNSTATGEKAS